MSAVTEMGPTRSATTPGGTKPVVLVALLVAAFLINLETTMVNVTLPVLVRELHATTNQLQWIVDAYNLVFAALLLTMGSLSDRFGRRPVVLISNIGLGLDYILMALAPGIGLLFAGRIISGITGASMSTAQAYIADVTPPDKRAASFGLMSVAFGLGFILGPAIGGVLGQIDPRLPFWVAAGLSLSNACYGFLVLPESLPPADRRPYSWRKANPLGSLTFLRANAGLLPLAAVHFLFWLSRAVLPAIMVLYVTYRYHLSIAAIGLFFASVGLGSMVVGGLLVKPVVARIGERASLIIGLLCGAGGALTFGLAGGIMWFALGVPLMSLLGLAGPGLLGLMTRRINPASQGQLQGALGSVTAISQMIGPGLFSFLFAHSLATHGAPGTPFYVAAGLLAVAAMVAARSGGGDASIAAA